jgi:NAD(P)H-hydrate epimerase
MSRADAATIEAGTSAEELMDRAGRAVARAVIRVLGGRYGNRVLVVCGKGNNGGDGFVTARILAQEGLGVRCVALFDPAEAKGAALHHLRRMEGAGLALHRFAWPLVDGHWDVVVDAIFGTGFRGRPEGLAAEAIDYLQGANVVAVDIPSGVSGATGEVEGEAIKAAVTVAIAAQKVGTAVPPGSLHAGEIDVVDIGIDTDIDSDVEYRLADDSDVRERLTHLRATTSHKRSAPVAVLTGSDRMRGAALLTARGAMRMGSGYVTLGTTRKVMEDAHSAMPELLGRVVTEADHLGPDSLEAFKEVIADAQALAIGPGLGRGDEQTRLVERALKELEIPLVLDADALNALEGKTHLLREREHTTVMTPHPGELARLLGRSTKEVVADRLGAARELAAMVGDATTVIVKGNRSIIGTAGHYTIIPTGGPELATAGTGDVLTGAVAALLRRPDQGPPAQPPHEEAITAAYVHGLAGTVAGETVGPSGVVAWDVAEAIPETIRRITQI